MTEERQHSKTAASSAYRWLRCNPSAMLEAGFPDKSSAAADEGTAAHALGEYLLLKALNRPTKRPQSEYECEEMQDHAEDYAGFVLETLEAVKRDCADPFIAVEQRVDFARYVDGGFGTCDALIIGGGKLHIVDLKYGKNIVEAENNPQLKLYALGALDMFGDLYDIDEVSMTIFQPRRENVCTSTETVEPLYQWADEVLRPNAERAVKGEGDFVPGDHCLFCRAKNRCRARADANLELAKLDFELPPLLSDDDITNILGKLDELKNWAESLKKYALSAALAGTKFNGWKLVAGRSNREYSDTQAVAGRLLRAGYRDIYQPPKLLGITEMTKAVGKKRFSELLEGAVMDENGKPTYEPLVHKPQGKPTLAPETDKRQELNVNNAAEDFAEDFADYENSEE